MEEQLGDTQWACITFQQYINASLILQNLSRAMVCLHLHYSCMILKTALHTCHCVFKKLSLFLGAK
jgi:hypothetical protein